MSTATSEERHAPPLTRELLREPRTLIVTAIVLVLLGFFYRWSAGPETRPSSFGEPPKDYYNLLVEGMLDGHLSLKTPVPPELLALADPYNPANRPPGVGLHDVSMYRGRYYLYFGVAPVVTLLLPFRVLTGHGLPLPIAVLVFSCLGLVATTVTFTLVRRRYFPNAAPALSGLLVFALGTASMVPILVRRGNIWELPLASGYCFSALALLAVYGAIHAVGRERLCLALASLCLGLAVASRPTYLYGVGMLLVPVVMRWPRRAAGKSPWALVFADVAAGFGPLILVGLGLAAYNYARFGDPLEFGIAYQFSGIYEAHARHFSWSYLGYNLRLYLLTPVLWGRYFPFIHPMAVPPGPAGHVGVEEAFGLLPNLPILWCALAIPLATRRRPSGDGARLATWAAAATLLMAGPFVTLAFFYAAIGRYEIDFVPTAVLLGTIGVLAIARAASGLTAGRGALVRVVASTLVVASAAFGVLLSLVRYGQFAREAPVAYARIGRVLDYPAYGYEAMARTAQGPLELEVRFPANLVAGREPLVRTGWPGAADHLYVQYSTGGMAAIGFGHDDGGETVSAPFPVAPDSVYRLHVEMGSLYPPEEHPVFRGAPLAAVHERTRRLRVTLDGRSILDVYQRFHPGSPGTLRIGQEPSAQPYGSRFTGTLRVVRQEFNVAALRASPTAPAPANATGVRLRLELPGVFRAGRRVPIVTTGATGQADFLFLEYLTTGDVRLGLEHWGKPPVFSESLHWAPQTVHTLEITLGSLRAPGESGSDCLEIVGDGRLVWSTRTRFYPAGSEDIFVGSNPLGGTACEAAFDGAIRDAERVIGATNR